MPAVARARTGGGGYDGRGGVTARGRGSAVVAIGGPAAGAPAPPPAAPAARRAWGGSPEAAEHRSRSRAIVVGGEPAVREGVTAALGARVRAVLEDGARRARGARKYARRRAQTLPCLRIQRVENAPTRLAGDGTDAAPTTLAPPQCSRLRAHRRPEPPMLPLALLSHSACTPATALADCTGSACVNGTCACDAGWTGARCAEAALGPATRAFTMPHTWLWGAAPARAPPTATTPSRWR